MHLYGDTLESYVARKLPAPTLAAIDAHVSNCLFCAHALADQGSVSNRWERRGWLGRLVRVDDPAWTDGRSDEELRAKAA